MKRGWIGRVPAAGVVLLVCAIGASSSASPQRPSQSSQLDEMRSALDNRALSRSRGSGPHEFYFTRAIYGSHGRSWRRGSWAVDFPKADRQFVFGLRRLTGIDASESENPVLLTDPELYRFPFLYALEVGYMSMSEEEVVALKRYLMAGGFLFIDDFWGTWVMPRRTRLRRRGPPGGCPPAFGPIARVA